jgi:penicillin-binding protein 1C
VLNRLGAESFEARIEGAGIRLYRPKAGLKDAGLALALGGLGIRLEDLAELYAGLGDGGLIKPLNYTQGQVDAARFDGGARLMSQSAAEKVLAILRETPAPAGRLPSSLMRVGYRPAYKTGTSYSFRDALAVGVAGGYAVMVWTGRPDGGPRVDMTGREASAPLLFDVFDQIAIPSQAPNRVTPARAPEALKAMQGQRPGPSILFPPQGATLYVESGPVAADGALQVTRGLRLSARGKGPLAWYVDGAPLINADPDRADQGPEWKPGSEGFYKVSVVDGDGLDSTVSVRVRSVTSARQP